jgi:DNA-binding NtrC family response regulator
MCALQNAIHQALVLSDGAPLQRSDFRLVEAVAEDRPAVAVISEAPATSAPQDLKPLHQIEAEAIAIALRVCRGRVSETARRLEIGRSTLYRKMEEYGLDPKAIAHG